MALFICIFMKVYLLYSLFISGIYYRCLLIFLYYVKLLHVLLYMVKDFSLHRYFLVNAHSMLVMDTSLPALSS